MGTGKEAQGISKVDTEEDFQEAREGLCLLEETRVPLCRTNGRPRFAAESAFQERVVHGNDPNRRLHHVAAEKRAEAGMSGDTPLPAHQEQSESRDEGLDAGLSAVRRASFDSHGVAEDLSIPLTRADCPRLMVTATARLVSILSRTPFPPKLLPQRGKGKASTLRRRS